MRSEWQNEYRSDAKKYQAEIGWTFRRILFFWVLPLMLLSGVLYVIGVGTGLFGKIVNPENIIERYEWFEQQAKDIKAIDQQISIAEKSEASFREAAGPRDKWTFQDREESSRLASHVTGLKQQRQSMAAAYNARASMVTRSMFKSKNLPESIE